jgi:hypothetical protein
VSEQTGRIQPTRARTLLLLGGCGVVIGWFSVPVFESIQTSAPTVGWQSVLALAFLAAVLLGTAWSTWRALHRLRRYIEPHRAVNLLVIAKASALVGALVAGGYLGFGAQFLDSLDIMLPRQRVIRSGLAVLASLVMMVGGLLLERALKVPGEPEENSGV